MQLFQIVDIAELDIGIATFHIAIDILILILMVAGLDIGDRQVLEQKYNGCDPPCLLDSSDGRLIM